MYPKWSSMFMAARSNESWVMIISDSQQIARRHWKLDWERQYYNLFNAKEVSPMTNSPWWYELTERRGVSSTHQGEFVHRTPQLALNKDFNLFSIVWKFLQSDWLMTRGVKLKFTSLGGEFENRRWIWVLFTLSLANQMTRICIK